MIADTNSKSSGIIRVHRYVKNKLGAETDRTPLGVENMNAEVKLKSLDRVKDLEDVDGRDHRDKEQHGSKEGHGDMEEFL